LTSGSTTYFDSGCERAKKTPRAVIQLSDYISAILCLAFTDTKNYICSLEGHMNVGLHENNITPR